MTAAEVAQHFGARRIGPGRWLARCPSHSDKNPSLGITEGQSGRTLLLCRSAGCATSDILKAGGLAWRDLFPDGPPPSPAQRAAQQAAREAEAARRRQQRAAERTLEDRAARLDRLVNSIGAKLAQIPEDDQLAALFHDLCWRRGEALMALEEQRTGPALNGAERIIRG